MYLGSLDLPKPQWRALAALLEARITGQASLFEADTSLQTLADQVFEQHEVKESLRHARLQQEAKAEMVRVDLASATTSKHRSLGPELVANAFFDRLRITAILKRCGLSESQRDLAKAVIIGRLIEPGSDLSRWLGPSALGASPQCASALPYLLRKWWRWMRTQSSLPEFLHTDLENIGKDAVYEIADRLWLCKDALEQGLRAVEGILFPCDESIFLYDLTNTYFEGACRGNNLAKHGKSKEQRSDCPLVTLALAVDAHGFPLFSQIYEGNQSEPATLTQVLDCLEADAAGLFQSLRPTLIMDRGIATADNLALIQARRYPNILIERRDLNQEFTSEFERAREDFAVISGEKPGEMVYVKKLERSKDESEIESTKLLCFSEGRAEKESGIDTNKDKRFRDDLTRLQKSVAKGGIQAVDKVNQRIGRLRERYPSIAKYYDISLILTAAGKKVTNLTFEAQSSLETRTHLHGCYVIQTSHHDFAAERIWRLYTTLTRVESAFRALKSDLGFRPVRHHIERRTQAHLFISVLAYHLLASIEQSLRQQGDHRTWATIKKNLETHQRSTLSLRGEGRILHQIRLSSNPEPAHQKIYQLLNIKDPLPRTRIDRLMQM